MADGEPTIGEIQTGLLLHSTPATSGQVTGLLTLTLGAVVRHSSRPQPQAVSPAVLTGVDCDLPTSGGGRTRGVGTVVTRTRIIGGHIAQATASTTLVQPTGRDRRRRPWSHYLAQRGRIECLGKISVSEIADTYLLGQSPAGDRGHGQLNLAAVSAAALDRVQGAGLDRRPPLRFARTTFRFAVGVPGPARFAVDDRGTLRRLWLPPTGAPLAEVISLCEDIARHDWLLTTVMSELARPVDARAAQRYVAVLRTLEHLWLPGSRLEPALAPVWSAIEGRTDMSRQWRSMVTRLRNHVVAARWAALDYGLGPASADPVPTRGEEPHE
jgi:hypothetical protein